MHTRLHLRLTESRAVLSWFDAHHHVVISKHCRDWEDAARKSLAENKNVRLSAIVITLSIRHQGGKSSKCMSYDEVR